jgi:hypothetical protein
LCHLKERRKKFRIYRCHPVLLRVALCFKHVVFAPNHLTIEEDVACREVVERSPSTQSYLLLGDAYMAITEPERALEVYEQVKN